MIRISIVLVLGGMLFLAGQGLMASSFLPGDRTVDGTIPAGPEWFYVYRVEVLGPARVEGHFADPTGRPVDFFVFAQSEYDVYAQVGLSEPLFAGQGSGVDFSVPLESSGTYYLVLDHGDGFEWSVQEVRMSVRILGIEPQFLVVGLALIGSGIVAVAMALRRKAAHPAE